MQFTIQKTEQKLQLVIVLNDLKYIWHPAALKCDNLTFINIFLSLLVKINTIVDHKKHLNVMILKF